MYTPSKFITMKKLKDLALMVSEKKSTLMIFQMRNYVSYLPWMCGIFMIYMTYLTILKSFNFIGKEHKNSVNII